MTVPERRRESLSSALQRLSCGFDRVAARLKPLEVMRTYDGLISPPGPKMVICLCPEKGLFVRVNSKG
jgi:hypothetical protein